jgi:dTDP-4-amino-4,6-dideoxygalactose transaminase
LAEANFIPYALPDIGKAEQDAVRDTLASGWVTTGPNCRAFEEEFSAYLGGDSQAIAVNSATSGLHLALEALGIGLSWRGPGVGGHIA